MSFSAIFVRLLVASFLGCLVGLERHRADKSAGMRTHMLVSLGSALIMIVSAYGFDDVIRPTRVVLDPSRVAAQVVSGVGFLGAGMILRRNSEVYGLTTAAGIWAAAGIGLAAGAGLYVAALVGTTLILVILAAIRPLEDRLLGRIMHYTVALSVRPGAFAVGRLEALVKEAGLDWRGLQLDRVGGGAAERITITLGCVDERRVLTLVEQLRADPDVTEVGFQSRHL